MDELQTPQEEALDEESLDVEDQAWEEPLEEEAEEEWEDDPIPTYPPGIEQLRLIFARHVDPRDTMRVYLRLGAIGVGVYYLATGIFGILTGG